MCTYLYHPTSTGFYYSGVGTDLAFDDDICRVEMFGSFQPYWLKRLLEKGSDNDN